VIFAIRNGLLGLLSSWGYPVSVQCGVDRPSGQRKRHHVVIDFDDSSGDSFGPAPGGSASRVLTCNVGYVVQIFASDYRAGAMRWEHQAEVGKLRDAVIVALRDWALAQRAGNVTLLSGRMMTPEELGQEAPTVAGYVMQVRVPRSVDRRDYDGSGVPTAEVFGASTTRTNVSLDGDTYQEI
jgi:hypothetical protein